MSQFCLVFLREATPPRPPTAPSVAAITNHSFGRDFRIGRAESRRLQARLAQSRLENYIRNSWRGMDPHAAEPLREAWSSNMCAHVKESEENHESMREHRFGDLGERDGVPALIHESE